MEDKKKLGKIQNYPMVRNPDEKWTFWNSIQLLFIVLNVHNFIHIAPNMEGHWLSTDNCSFFEHTIKFNIQYAQIVCYGLDFFSSSPKNSIVSSFFYFLWLHWCNGYFFLFHLPVPGPVLELTLILHRFHIQFSNHFAHGSSCWVFSWFRCSPLPLTFECYLICLSSSPNNVK